MTIIKLAHQDVLDGLILHYVNISSCKYYFIKISWDARMITGRLLFLSIVASLLIACVAAPQKAVHQPYVDKCKDMVTRKIELNHSNASHNALKDCAIGSNVAACVITVGVLSSLSSVVSGSILIIGNTLHWMEYKTTC